MRSLARFNGAVISKSDATCLKEGPRKTKRLALAKNALKPVKRIIAVSIVNVNAENIHEVFGFRRPLLVPCSYPLAVDKKYWK
jgi:hypothetical protein